MHHAAAIIIKENKVLLIERADEESGKWCPPNETLKKGETPESAVVRGALEEVGLRFIIKQNIHHHTFNGHTTHVYIGNADGIIKLNPEEASDSGWFTFNEIKKLPMAFGYDLLMNRLHSEGYL
jgi:ADP-ribose pyrophosphatase YjhB (NUDIX family)